VDVAGQMIANNVIAMYKILLILLLFASSDLLAQKRKKIKDQLPHDDTTFTIVNLDTNFSKNQILVYELGEKAILYFPFQRLKMEAKAIKDTAGIKYLDSIDNLEDTIAIDFRSPHFDIQYHLSMLLKKGDVKVFYKKENSFVGNIMHRQERYGKYVHRFFYLPDHRPFFSIMELTVYPGPGIFSNYNELVNLGEKLQSLYKQ
jgi:hypothetical protein